MELRWPIGIYKVHHLILMMFWGILWFQSSDIAFIGPCLGQQLKPLVEPILVSANPSIGERNPISQPLIADPSSTVPLSHSSSPDSPISPIPAVSPPVSSPPLPSSATSFSAENKNQDHSWRLFEALGNRMGSANEGNQVEDADADLVNFFDSIHVEDFYEVAMSPYRIYRTRQNILELVSYSDGDLGWASLIGTPYLKRGQSHGLTLGMSHHFLSGPEQADLNPRLHEFVLGYQARTTWRDRLSLDLAATVGFYSDFKGSAREGLRLPGHAVAIFHASHRLDWVLGIDYLDRQDYRLLPVFGISWHDFSLTSLRYDLVFPRPRIELTLSDASRIYLQGNLGGGTWDVELADGTEDLMTYRDYRVLIGSEKRFLDGSRRGLEVGYAFSRRLQLNESLVTLDFGNAVLFRLVSSF